MLRRPIAFAPLLIAALASFGRAQPPEPSASLTPPPAGAQPAIADASQPKKPASALPELAQANAHANEILKIFDLKHLDAESAAEMLEAIYKPSELTLVADKRLGDLVMRGDAQVLQEVEVLLLRLDEPAASKRAKPGDALKPIDLNRADTLASLEELYQALMAGQASAESGKAQAGKGTAPSIYSLRDRLGQVEDLAARAAERARLTQSQSGSGQNYEAEKNEVRQRVTEAFRLRQSLQRAEVHQFLTRLLQISQTIEMREGAASLIIERRMRELLGPEAASSSEVPDAETPAEQKKVSPLLLPAGAAQATSAPPAVPMVLSHFRFCFRNVTGAYTIQWITRTGAAVTEHGETLLTLPSGQRSEFRIMGFSGVDLRPFVSVDVPQLKLTERSAAIVSLNNAYLTLEDDDLEKLKAGELLTRIFWIPNDLTETSAGLIMVSDNAADIAKRGTVVATLKIATDAKKVLADDETKNELGRRQ